MNDNKVNYGNKSGNRCNSGCNSGCSCGGRCGNFCKCANGIICDNEDKLIFFDDNSYAIYRLDSWNNEYSINLLGIDNEIPATKITRDQSLKVMEEIRKYNFTFKGVEINGMVGLAIRYNNIKYNVVDELISLEELEYKNIKKELANLKLENPKDFIELNNEKFLIYKVKENCHGAVMSRPVNKFTRKYSSIELSKIKLSSI